jgi:putative protease
MRREAVERLIERGSAIPERTTRDPHATIAALRRSVARDHLDGEPQIHLLIRTPDQLDAAIALSPASVTLDYLDLEGLKPSVRSLQDGKIQARVAAPRVLKPQEGRIVDLLLRLECAILVRSSSLLQALQERKHPELIGDASLNAANAITAELFLAMGLSRLTPAHDLNGDQVAELVRSAGADRFEAVAYHHLPVFHTEHCVFCRFLSTGTSYLDCGRPCDHHRVELRDHSGRSHPVMADFGCRNTVFGAEAQEASVHLEKWLNAGIRDFRLEFVHESADEVTEIGRAFRDALSGDCMMRSLGEKLRRLAPQGTTQGSLVVLN